MILQVCFWNHPFLSVVQPGERGVRGNGASCRGRYSQRGVKWSKERKISDNFYFFGWLGGARDTVPYARVTPLLFVSSLKGNFKVTQKFLLFQAYLWMNFFVLVTDKCVVVPRTPPRDDGGQHSCLTIWHSPCVTVLMMPWKVRILRIGGWTEQKSKPKTLSSSNRSTGHLVECYKQFFTLREHCQQFLRCLWRIYSSSQKDYTFRFT